MALYTIADIQSGVAALIDQSATAPTASGDEYAWRLKFINRAYQEWASAYDWEATRKEMFLNPTGVSQASISLPADFRIMAMQPLKFASDGVAGGTAWPEIVPEDRRLYDSTDDFFYILGSRENNVLVWNPAELSSGASILISYFSYPSSLASPTNTVLTPNPEFLVERTIAYILETRGDPRYQQSESKAREMLTQMVENEKNKGLSLDDHVKTSEELAGFRLGRD